MSIRDISFTLPNSHIAALTNAKSTKPLLIMVHGWLDNAASFSPLIPYLDDYHVIAIDLPGHGKSSHRSADAHYHLIDYVNDLHALITSQHWHSIFFVGHSLGGIISSIYCAAFPERVSKFVCIESAGPLTELESTSIEQIRQSILSRLQADDKEIKQPEDLESIIRARQKVSDLSFDNAKVILSRNTQLDPSGQLIWSTDKRLRTKSTLRLTSGQAENIMSQLACLTHFVLGSNGFSKVSKLLHQRSGLLKNYQVTELEGGHHVHMEACDEVAKIISTHFDAYK
ncbi:alpha/beta hydrolase [Glaciecola sp. MH2013]|uniref:alpha/beta fold hydrolase n=1 Tax=Glaciecola sp. MH2013 TaxID=2785524 RepID=UPI00189DDFAD|nr:alpha/beta hydrolase [Glaciecola sp. MH2013]MBF7072503.1 alpha/beta hydrolase [Glaciecola sp. MH2013]